jgi:hypothetical protein
MKFYFASASANWTLVRNWIEGAKGLGHEVTMDWTLMVEEFGRGNPEVNSQSMLSGAAVMDRQGVRDCDTFVLIWDDEVCGALLETGMALELEKPVWLVHVNPRAIRYCIFWEMPNVERMDYAELRDRLFRLSPRGTGTQVGESPDAV